jgi:diguanylate cyclase (GGDEF)-like protein
MLFILLIELVIFVLTIKLAGAYDDITGSICTDLVDMVQYRGEGIELKLNEVSGEASAKYNDINALVNEYEGKSDSEVLSAVGEYLKTADTDLISGAFVVLGNSTDEDNVSALYVVSPDGSKRFGLCEAVIASKDVLAAVELNKGDGYKQSFSADSFTATDFVTEPVKLKKANKDISGDELGCWSMPYSVKDSECSYIAYSMPLCNSDGDCVGVYGVNVDLADISDMLPYQELNSKGGSGYFIVCGKEGDESNYRVVTSFASTLPEAVENWNSDSVDDEQMKNGAYKLSVGEQGYYLADKTLSIWKNSLYNHEEWKLCAAIDSSYIDLIKNAVEIKVLCILAITTIIGMIFALIISGIMAAPIHKFLNEVKRIRPDNPVLPSRSSVSEINELGLAVETLTHDITDFSSKVSTIIDLAGLHFGAFEYDPNSDFVYCTDMIFGLLNMEKYDEQLFVPKSVFEEKIGLFGDTLVPGISQEFVMELPRRGYKYIYIKTADNNGKILGVLQDTTEEKIQERARKLEKDYDELTSLYNRTAFRKFLNKKFNGDIRFECAVLMHCNIDDMSDINMRYGNGIGDKYIQSIGTAFKRYLNKSDCFIARTAGDEFKVLMLGDSRQKLEDKLQAIIGNVYSTKLLTPNGFVPVRASTGVAWYPENADNVALLEQYAEFTMRQVKRGERNSYQYFDKAAFDEAEKNIRSSRDIEMLITDGLIRYAFQPIIAVKTGDIYGYEALMRPDSQNVITPHDVIVFATEQNKLGAIEKLTWYNALEDFSVQMAASCGRKMFINSIPSQFLKPEEFAELEENYGDYLCNIVLEIIENEQTDPEIIKKKKQLVEKWNCLLALDDYGSGYANDNTLLSLKPDVIKLDIELITGIEEDKDRQTLVTNIIQYAHQRGILVLGEGIETSTQMRTLIKYGVDLMQGFYLAKPNFNVLESLDDSLVKEINDIRDEFDK